MDLKAIYEALAGLDNGSELTKALNVEVNGLRSEAADWRTKYGNVAETLGIKGSSNTDEALAGLKTVLGVLSANGNKPDEIGRRLQDLANEVKTLTEKAEAEEKKAKTEHDKRIIEVKHNKAVAALSKGKAVNPAEIVKIILSNIAVKDDDTLAYVDGDRELSIEDGVQAWLTANPWAISNTQSAGAGSSNGGAAGSVDPEKMSMEEYAKWYAERNKK